MARELALERELVMVRGLAVARGQAPSPQQPLATGAVSSVIAELDVSKS